LLLAVLSTLIILAICIVAVWVIALDISSAGTQPSPAPSPATPGGISTTTVVLDKNNHILPIDNLEEDSRYIPVSILVNFEHPLSSEERPYGLVTLDQVFGGEVSYGNGDASMDPRAGAAAKEMFKAALAEDIAPYTINSAYRSVSYQNTLFENRRRMDPLYGSDPYRNPVRVLPGNCSEHATGLAIDILNTNCQAADDSFGETPEGRWLAEHAHEYGYVLRYPKNKEHITGVIYEPWHFRYVGQEIAGIMHDQDLCLEEYCAKYLHP